MTANRTSPPLGALLAALLLADVLSAKRVPSAAPGTADGLPPGLEALFRKDSPFREGQEHQTGNTQRATEDLAAEMLAQAGFKHRAEAPADGERSDEEAEPGHISSVLITPELAALVGLTPDMDRKSLEGDTRLLAAALIANVRKLGAQAVDNFPAAGAKLSGIRFVENTILSALHTFSTLAKRSA